MKVKLITIGASMGGVEAIQQLFSLLPRDFTIPLAIVMHLPQTAEIDHSMVFSRFPGKIVEAEDKTEIKPGYAYFAPPGYHLLVESDLTLSLSLDEAVHFARPSIDVLFESAAQSLGDDVCGVLLTGANEDGAAGLQEIKARGGVTIVQDPATAAVSVMPSSALKIMKPEYILNIHEIALKISGGSHAN